MKHIKTKIVHSQTKPAWNIVGETLGGKYKVARIPYTIIPDNEILSFLEKKKAYEYAEFIKTCLNNSEEIIKIIK